MLSGIYFDLISLGVLTNLLSFLVGVIGYYAIGLNRFKGFNSSGVYLTIGWILVAISYAVFKTSFNTSASILLFFLIGFSFLTRKERKIVSTLDVKALSYSFLTVLIASVILVPCHILILTNFNLHAIPYVTGDYDFYSRLTGYLSEGFGENISLDVFHPELRKNNPYHYMEFWFVGFWSNLWKLPSGLFLIAVGLPYFILATVLCAKEIAIRYLQSSLFSYLLAVTFLFIGVWGYLYPNVGMFASDVWDLAPMEYPKLLPVYPFFLLAGLLIFERSSARWPLLVIGTMGFVFQTLLPACGIVIIGIYVYHSFLVRRLRNEALLPFLLFLVSCLLWVLFYWLQPQEVVTNSILSEVMSLDHLGSLSYFKTGFNIFVKTTIQISFILLPIIVVYFAFRKRLKLDVDVYLVLILVLVPILAWVALNPMHDSVQTWGIFFMPIANVLIYITVILLLKQAGSSRLFGLLLLLSVLPFHFDYGMKPSTYHVESKNVINDLYNREFRVGYFNREDFNYAYFETFTEVFTPAKWLISICSPFSVTCLNPWVVLEGYSGNYPQRVEQYIYQTPILIDKVDYRSSNEDELIGKFISEHKFNGIIFHRDDQHLYSEFEKIYGRKVFIDDGWILIYQNRLEGVDR